MSNASCRDAQGLESRPGGQESRGVHSACPTVTPTLWDCGQATCSRLAGKGTVIATSQSCHKGLRLFTAPSLSWWRFHVQQTGHGCAIGGIRPTCPGGRSSRRVRILLLWKVLAQRGCRVAKARGGSRLSRALPHVPLGPVAEDTGPQDSQLSLDTADSRALFRTLAGRGAHSPHHNSPAPTPRPPW